MIAPHGAPSFAEALRYGAETLPRAPRHASGLGLFPLAEEHYDFAFVSRRKNRPAVQAFINALASDEARAALANAGFRPA